MQSSLYIPTLPQIAEVRKDINSLVHNSLFTMDVDDRVRALAGVGQLPLAYLLARTHGLQEDCNRIQQALGTYCCSLPLSFSLPSSRALSSRSFSALSVSIFCLCARTCPMYVICFVNVCLVYAHCIISRVLLMSGTTVMSRRVFVLSWGIVGSFLGRN